MSIDERDPADLKQVKQTVNALIELLVEEKRNKQAQKIGFYAPPPQPYRGAGSFFHQGPGGKVLFSETDTDEEEGDTGGSVPIAGETADDRVDYDFQYVQTGDTTYSLQYRYKTRSFLNGVAYAKTDYCEWIEITEFTVC